MSSTAIPPFSGPALPKTIDAIAQSHYDEDDQSTRLQLLEPFHDAVMTLDSGGRILTVDKAGIALFGRHRDEIIGNNFIDLGIISPDSQQAASELLGALVSGAGVNQAELSIIRTDGVTALVEATPKIVNIDGKEGVLQVTFRDISARKNAVTTKSMRISFLSRLVGQTDVNEIARLAFHHISSRMACDAGAILLRSADDASWPMEVVYSFDTDASGKLRISEKRDPTTLPPGSSMCKVVESARELVIHRTDDEVSGMQTNHENFLGFNNRVSKSLIFWPLTLHGKVIGILTVQSYAANAYAGVDLEFLRTAAGDLSLALAAARFTESLKESQEKYHNLYLSAHVGLFRTRVSDGKVIECNDYFARMMGYDDMEDCRANCYITNHYADPGTREKMLERMMLEGSVRDLEARFVRRDGRIGWGRYSGRLDPEKAHIEGVGIDITETKLAQDRIKELAKFPDEDPNPVLRVSNEGMILYANSAALAILNHWRCAVSDYLPAELLGPLKRVCESNQEEEIEITIGDGVYSMILVPIASLGYINIYGREITKRKKAEERLFKINECFLGLGTDPVENIYRLTALCGDMLKASCAVYCRDENGSLRTVAAWNMPADYNAAENSSCPMFHDTIANCEQGVFIVRDLPHSKYAVDDLPAGLSEFQTYIGNAVKCGNQFQGSLGVLFAHAMEPNDDDFRVLSIISSAIEAEEDRNQAKSQLQIEKTYLEQLFESAPEAIVVVDNDGSIVKINSEFTRMFGYPIEEAIGQSIDSLLAPGELEVGACSLTRKVIEGERISTEAVRYRKDGTPVDVSILGTPINHGGGQIAVYGIYRDITERRKAEELQNARTDFLSKLVGLTDATDLANLTFQHLSHQIPIDAASLILSLNGTPRQTYEVVFSADTDEMGVVNMERKREQCQLGLSSHTIKVFQTGRPEIVHRSPGQQEEAVAMAVSMPAFNEHKSRSLAFLPLKIHGRTIGVLSVQSYQPDIFDERRVAVLEQTTADLALALTAARMTEAFRNEEERYRIVVEQTKQMIYDYDVNTGNIAWTGAVESITGFTPQEFRKVDIEAWAELVHPDDRQTTIRSLEKAMMERGRYQVEYRIRCKEGSYVYIEDNGVCVVDERNRPCRMLGTMKDITENRRAKELLEQSEEKYRRLVETMPNGLAIIDLDQNINFANPAACSILGYTHEELLASNLKQIIIDEDAPRLLEQTEKCRRGEPSEYEETARTKDGRLRNIYFMVVPLMDESGTVGGAVAIFTDMTELKNSEHEKQELREKLARAQKMESLGILAGGVAHDLNNILGPLVAYPEIIRMKLPPDSPIASQIAKIEKSAQRAADVVQDLLTMARRGRYEMSPVSINSIIENYLASPDFYDTKSRFSSVTMQTELQENVAMIYGSEAHLSKVIMNLILNAFDAMPHGGTLTVRTQSQLVEKLIGGFDNIESGLYTILTVSDTGIGISPKDIKRMFEPFYTKKEMGKSGSGLGLAIVYGVVKDHNGYIDVRSELNEGSDFILYFPSVVSHAGAEKSSADIRGTEKILVVDDVPEQRELAATVLASLGYKVEVAANGHDAVEHLRHHQADVVILDMIMEPGFDGLDTYREILKSNPGQKAIITSGFSETGRVKEAEKLGVGKYVRKPYTMQKLGKAIREILVPTEILEKEPA